jgi:hypothetical protein
VEREITLAAFKTFAVCFLNTEEKNVHNFRTSSRKRTESDKQEPRVLTEEALIRTCEFLTSLLSSFSRGISNCAKNPQRVFLDTRMHD